MLAVLLCIGAGVGATNHAGDDGEVEQRRESAASAIAEPPDWMKWEPPWRRADDCGPLSLYILSQLSGHGVDIADVHDAAPITPNQGVSLASLAAAGEALGIPVTTRFLEPHRFQQLPFPAIVHQHGNLEQGTGHFGVVVAYSSDENAYAMIEPETANLWWVPDSVMQARASGYVLVLSGSTGISQLNLARCLMGVGFLLALATAVLGLRSRRGHAQRRADA